MPVANFQRDANTTLKRVINSPEISEKNREALKRFLDAYDVSPARLSIFLANIIRVLKKTDDITKDMHDRDKINKIFKELKEDTFQAARGTNKRKPQTYSPATIETIKNVSQRFVRWLNNGEKPEGFKDIKANKMAMKRSLEPNDMITWEDGLEIVKNTPSVQMKAAFLTQLDCGFRPSEFLDLRYGDVEVKDDMVIFFVRHGKTGSRHVWMSRAVPQFLRWYEIHPSKKKDDPLWLLENVKLSNRGRKVTTDRYNYRVLQLRFDLMLKKSGIDKPSDFYNLRHSSCVLDKMDNVPIDLAAERHGHSVEFFTQTYGRLSVEDKLTRWRNHYGEPEEKKTLLKNVECGRCKAINEPNAEFCAVCGVPLSVEQAAKVYNDKKMMEERIKNMELMVKVLAENNPKAKKSFDKYVQENIISIKKAAIRQETSQKKQEKP